MPFNTPFLLTILNINCFANYRFVDESEKNVIKLPPKTFRRENEKTFGSLIKKLMLIRLLQEMVVDRFLSTLSSPYCHANGSVPCASPSNGNGWDVPEATG